MGSAPSASLQDARWWRKLPVVIEAVQFTGGNWDAAREFLGEAFVRVAVVNGGVKAFRIRTLEGVMTVNRGDWIIKGVRGEFYPCKPDIFAATYEPVARAADSSEVSS